MELLLAKKQELEKELVDLVINVDDVEAKVAEFKENLLKQLQEDNSKKAEIIKTKLDFIDELINEEVKRAELKAATPGVEAPETEETPILQINPIDEETTENTETVVDTPEKGFY